MLLPLSASALNIEYQKIATAESSRVGKLVVRYFMSFEDPCLYVQLLSPGDNWQVIKSSSICSFQGRSFSTEFAHVGFENISVSNGAINLVLRIFPLRASGEVQRSCTIAVGSGIIGPLQCGPPVSPEYD